MFQFPPNGKAHVDLELVCDADEEFYIKVSIPSEREGTCRH